MINFKNKKILITGASGGIGKEIVKKFVNLDGNVIGSGTKSEKLDLIKKEFPNIKIKKFDFADHSRIEEFINEESSKPREERVEIVSVLTPNFLHFQKLFIREFKIIPFKLKYQ